MEEVAREAGVSRALVSLVMPFFAEMMDGIVEQRKRIDGLRTDPVHHRVEPSLVVRGTTGAPPSGTR